MYYDYEDLKEMVVWAYNNEVGTYIVGDRYDEDIYDEENDKYIPIWKFVKICKENGYEGWMLENIISIGLTIMCGVLALYSFIRSQGG